MHGSSIRWGRVIVAALLSEVAVFAVIGVVMVIYQFLIAPGQSDTAYEAFGERASYYVAPTAAGLAVFIASLWATRKITSALLVNSVTVGVIAVALSFGFLFTARPEDRLMYGVSFLLRIAGGYLAGIVAQRRSATLLRTA